MTTHPVAKLKPNPFGLYDIYGNVWEWVHDAYDVNYKPHITLNPVNSSGSHHLLRGGSYSFKLSITPKGNTEININNSWDLISYQWSSHCDKLYGFRLVRSKR